MAAAYGIGCAPTDSSEADPSGPSGPATPVLTSVAVKADGDKTQLAVGETVQLTVTAKDQKGDPYFGGTVAWSSVDPQVATVDASGLVRGVGNGSAKIVAKLESKEGSLQMAIQGAIHSGTIATSETWRAADNPHLVRGAVRIEGSGGPTLTIEAGAIVKFAKDAQLYVGYNQSGVLQVAGTAEAPVKFTSAESSPAPGDWGAIEFTSRASSASRIEHATIEYCGADWGSGKACVHVLGGGSALAVKMASVAIRQSAGSGVSLRGGGRFAAGSASLDIQNVADHPIRIDAADVATLPSGSTFANNARNMVRIAGNTVGTTQSWINPGIPYVLEGLPSSRETRRLS